MRPRRDAQEAIVEAWRHERAGFAERQESAYQVDGAEVRCLGMSWLRALFFISQLLTAAVLLSMDMGGPGPATLPDAVSPARHQ